LQKGILNLILLVLLSIEMKIGDSRFQPLFISGEGESELGTMAQCVLNI